MLTGYFPRIWIFFLTQPLRCGIMDSTVDRVKTIRLTGPVDYPCWWWKLAKDGETIPIGVVDVIIPKLVTFAERKRAIQLESELELS